MPHVYGIERTRQYADLLFFHRLVFGKFT